MLFNLAVSLAEIPDREREAREVYERFLREADADDPAVQERMRAVQERIRELDARLASRPGSSGDISPIGPTVGALGGAVLLVGFVLGAISLDQDASFRSMCTDLTACPPSTRPLYDEMRAYSTTADVLYAVGGIALATGIILTLALRDDGDDAELTAMCHRGGCIAAARGRF